MFVCILLPLTIIPQNKTALNNLQRTAGDVSGPVEADPEYQLIVEANNLAAELDDEIGNIHKFAKEKYSVRFPGKDGRFHLLDVI